MKVINTKNDIETINLGEKLGKLIFNEKTIILLEGNLASGKTTFTKGIAKGLGINEIVKSPTFTIMKEYQINNDKTLYHLDLYRLTEMGLDFDLEEYIYNENSIVVIEWPNQVKELLPEEFISIKINGINNEREFLIKGFGKKYEEIVELLWKN